MSQHLNTHLWCFYSSLILWTCIHLLIDWNSASVLDLETSFCFPLLQVTKYSPTQVQRCFWLTIHVKPSRIGLCINFDYYMSSFPEEQSSLHTCLEYGNFFVAWRGTLRGSCKNWYRKRNVCLIRLMYSNLLAMVVVPNPYDLYLHLLQVSYGNPIGDPGYTSVEIWTSQYSILCL